MRNLPEFFLTMDMDFSVTTGLTPRALTIRISLPYLHHALTLFRRKFTAPEILVPTTVSMFTPARPETGNPSSMRAGRSSSTLTTLFVPVTHSHVRSLRHTAQTIRMYRTQNFWHCVKNINRHVSFPPETSTTLTGTRRRRKHPGFLKKQ